MKKSKNTNSSLAHKNLGSSLMLDIRALFMLLLMLSVIIVAENFFTILSYIKPVEVKQVLAIEEVKDAESLLSPTPAPKETELFSLASFTASPTPTPTPFYIEQPKGDFCLNVPILIYHHVQPLAEAQTLGHAQLTVDSGIFDGQIQYLVENGYNLISSSDVVAALQNHTQLPAKSIVVTLDDGYDDFYNYAFPIAKKHNAKMDFMIPSGLVGNPGYLTWDQLKEIAQNPLISIYNHTWSHRALGDADLATINQEVMTSNTQLEATLGKKINIFVYPYGSFGPLVIQFLQEHGFAGGISTLDGTIQCSSYIMTLHRTHIGNAPMSSYGF